MRTVIYTIALLAVVICVFIILVAPDIDLPDSTVLRAKAGLHLVITTINLAASLPLLLLVIFSTTCERKPFRTRLEAPSGPTLCTFLC